MKSALSSLPAPELLARMHELVRRGRRVEAELLAHLGEVDARGLHVEEGCSSMFDYCQRVLHFAEAVAYKRIQAARAARRFPELLAAVRRGELHLTAVSLLAPRLTAANACELIRAARHRSAEQIRRLLADREPRPAVPASVRRLPDAGTAAARTPERADRGAAVPDPAPRAGRAPELAPGAGAGPAAAAASEAGGERSSLARPEPKPSPGTQPPASAAATEPPSAHNEPLGGGRYAIRFTADGELHAQLQELRALLRHRIPDGDLGKILALAVGDLLAKVRRRKFGECGSPRASKPEAGPSGERPSRHIPAAVRRAVARRDGERCSYVSPSGRRCEAREFLEFDHREPWARTKAHPIDGIRLRCRAHNQLAARREFGDRHMARFTKRSRTGRDGADEEPPPPRNLIRIQLPGSSSPTRDPDGIAHRAMGPRKRRAPPS